MANIQDQITQAKAAGYTDADIAQHLSQKPEYAQKFKTAIDAGYKPEEIISHLSGAESNPPEKSWGDVAISAVKNTPKSLVNMIGGIANAVAHPIDTGKNVLDVMAGGLQNALPEGVNNLINKGNDWLGPENRKSADVAQKKASQVGAFYKDRYGSVPGFKNALAEDPAGVLSDASTVLTLGGGAISKVPKLGEVGNALTTTGNAINPINITTNALAKVSNATGLTDAVQALPKRLMQSAIKPNVKDLMSGDADIAIQTLLDKGISPNQKGVIKLRGDINDLNNEIAQKISTSNATVSKQDVLKALNDVQTQFTKQVNPVDDLAAIDKSGQGFMDHPLLQGINDIPVQTAQDLKQGTYQILNKKYGQIGSAETEAQKGLARGLKEGIANAVPDIAGLNAEESKLIKTLNVVEKKALIDMNKNPMGLSLLAGSPSALASFMADRSATFKALAARLINNASNKVTSGNNLINGSGIKPANTANYLYQSDQINQRSQ